MKLLLLSDLHLLWDRPRCRLDDVRRTCFKKLDFVLDYATRNKAVILQAGDFFERPRGWHLLVGYIRLLDIYRVPVYCVFGQHDQYFRSKRGTLLDALSAAGYVKILHGNPAVFDSDGNEMDHCKGKKDRKVYVYGCGYGEDAVPEVIDKGRWIVNILVAHRMVVAKRMWPGQEDYELADRFLKRHGGFDLVLCGDAHVVNHFVHSDGEGRHICNTGPMVRKSVDLWEHEPGFFVYDTGTRGMEWVEVPHEPPEKVMSRRHLDDTKETKRMLEDFVSSIDAKSGMGAAGDGEKGEVGSSFADNLAEFIKANDISEEIARIISDAMGEKEDD